MKNYNSINFRLSIVFILVIVSFAFVILPFNFYKNKENSYKYLHKLTNEITASMISKTYYYINKTNTPIKVLSHSNKDTNILKNKTQNINLMKEYIFSESNIASFYLADFEGNFLQVRQSPKLATREIQNTTKRVETWEYKDKNFNTIHKTNRNTSFDPRKRVWYKNAKNNQIIISNPYIYESTGELGITISYPLIKEGKKSIVTGVDITLKSLKKFLKQLSKNINGTISIIDNNNRIISSSHYNNIIDLNKTNEANNIIKAAKTYLKGNNTGNIEILGAKKYLYTGKSFKIDNSKQWHILITIAEEIVLKDSKKTLNEAILISLIVLIFFILISIILSRKITKPIVNLSKNMDDLKHLNLNTKIDSSSSIKEIKEAQESLLSLKNALFSFSKYMPVDLVKILIGKKEEIKIGGEEKNLVIMFTDIEGFTTISEKMSPKELTDELSNYFTVCSDIIKNNNGTIDKYIGDSIMAFWGAPLDIDSPIEKALSCALEIQKELYKINKINQSQNKPIFKTRIGIHYGKTLVGNIGSNSRMNYTIIGDSVNIASRIEGINKNYDTSILLSKEIFDFAEGKFEMDFVDEIELKGKTQRTKIFSLNKKLN